MYLAKKFGRDRRSTQNHSFDSKFNATPSKGPISLRVGLQNNFVKPKETSGVYAPRDGSLETDDRGQEGLQTNAVAESGFEQQSYNVDDSVSQQNPKIQDVHSSHNVA